MGEKATLVRRVEGAVRGAGILLPPLLIALVAFFVFGACQGSTDQSVDPTAVPTATTVSSVSVDPTSAASSPTATAEPTPTMVSSPSPVSTPAAVAAPTAVAATPTPTVAPTPPQPTATAIPSPTPTLAPTLEPTATAFPLGGEFFLNLIEPAELDVFAESSSFAIVGQTRVDAVVTVNDDVVVPDAEGIFQYTITLEVGANIIEVVASVSSDEQASHVITAVYLP